MSDNEQPTEKRLTGQDTCICMHTALRKCCDSNITSAAYNLIHMIDIKPKKFNAWRILGECVAAEMNEHGKSGVRALANGIESLNAAFYEATKAARQKGDKEPEGARNVLYALQCTLKCFDKDDLEGMAAFLK